MTKIDKEKQIVTLKNGQQIQYDALITTTPLDLTLQWLGKGDVAERLEHRWAYLPRNSHPGGGGGGGGGCRALITTLRTWKVSNLGVVNASLYIPSYWVQETMQSLPMHSCENVVRKPGCYTHGGATELCIYGSSSSSPLLQAFA